jgi:hypothetical protein
MKRTPLVSMLTTAGSLVAAAVSLLATTGLSKAHAWSDLTDHSTTQSTLHFTGNGPHTLEIRTITGRINVEAYDGSDVQMTVDKTISADTKEELEAAKRDVVLDVGNNAAAVGAIVKYPNGVACGDERGWSRHDWHHHYDVRYDFTVKVPRNTRVELCSVNDGKVEVTGTQGDFDIHSVNGRITLTDVSGSGEAITVNGPVTASFVDSPQGRSTFKTINGEVSVTLPPNLSADLRMKTFNGGLYTDFDVTRQGAITNVTREKQGGMSVYRTTGYTSVRVGNGGPELTLESLNGDVRVIRRSK